MKVGDREVRVAVAHGTANAAKLLDSIQEVQDAFANATESTLGWFGGLFQ